jgi:transcriptional regulator with XRE-family HTH domain
MPSTTRKKVKRPAARATGGSTAGSTPIVKPVLRVAQELRRWTDAILGIAGSAADLSMTVAKARARGPKQRAAIDRAGSLLRRAREAAGLTTQELGTAIDLSNASLLEQAERGKVALPFEVILRLAGVLGRHDPITFALQLTRSYNADLWKALEDLGVGRLAVQAGRERELANIYRGYDAARRLSDEDFAAVLAFVKTGFEMAVDFRSDRSSVARVPADRQTARKTR